MKPVRTKDFIKQIESQGYIEQPGNGSSHRIFKCNGKPTLSVPNHGEVSPGVIRNLNKLMSGENKPAYMNH